MLSLEFSHCYVNLNGVFLLDTCIDFVSKSLHIKAHHSQLIVFLLIIHIFGAEVSSCCLNCLPRAYDMMIIFDCLLQLQSVIFTCPLCVLNCVKLCPVTLYFTMYYLGPRCLEFGWLVA